MDWLFDYPTDFNQWLIAWVVIIPLVAAAFVLPKKPAGIWFWWAAGLAAAATIGMGLFRLAGGPWIGLWAHFFVLGIVFGEIAGRMADQRDQPYARYFALGFLFTVPGLIAAWFILRRVAPVPA
jgi:hypothetical protein